MAEKHNCAARDLRMAHEAKGNILMRPLSIYRIEQKLALTKRDSYFDSVLNHFGRTFAGLLQ